MKRRRLIYGVGVAVLAAALTWWGYSLFRERAAALGEPPHEELIQRSGRVQVAGGQAALVEVPKYGIIDISLRAAESFRNPYLQMPGDDVTPGFVVATFAGPNGENLAIDGFWNGGDAWLVRMSPTAAGRWDYATSSSDPGLDGKRGSFAVVESAHRGFLRVNPDFPHSFMLEDGTPFLWMGATIGTFYLYPEKLDMRDGTFQAVHRALASAGYNNYAFSSQVFKKQGNFVGNEGGFNFLSEDADQLNPTYWQWVDLRLEFVNDLGIIPGILLGWPDQGIFERFTDAQLKRAWRYVIARYSAYNIVWNLFGEVDEAGPGWQSVAGDYGRLVEKFDPYDHLRTTHHVESSSALAGEPWYDFIVQQSKDIALADADRARYEMPVVNLESYYEGESGSAEDIRKFSWILMTHGAFFQYGKSRTAKLTEGQRYHALLFDFYERIPWWELEPMQALKATPDGAHGHARAGLEYVIYLESGGEISLDLSAISGDFVFEWFNPRTGEYSEQSSGTAAMENSFLAPGDEDWVLHVVKAGHGQSER